MLLKQTHTHTHTHTKKKLRPEYVADPLSENKEEQGTPSKIHLFLSRMPRQIGVPIEANLYSPPPRRLGFFSEPLSSVHGYVAKDYDLGSLGCGRGVPSVVSFASGCSSSRCRHRNSPLAGEDSSPHLAHIFYWSIRRTAARLHLAPCFERER